MKLKVLLVTLLVSGVVFAQNYKFGKVSKEELMEEYYPLDSTANAAYLCKSKQVEIRFNDQLKRFQFEEKIFLRIKIYNNKGFKYGNKSIFYYTKSSDGSDVFSKIKAVTYNLEGNKIVKQKVKKQNIFTDKKTERFSLKKISFPSLKPGSIIELKYSRLSSYFDIANYVIQEDIPVKKMYYSTSIPEYFVFKTRSKGYFTVTPKKEKINDFFVYTSRDSNTGSTIEGTRRSSTINYEKEVNEYEAENIPALKNDEPFTSNYRDYRGTINYELSYIRYPNSPMTNYAKRWNSVFRRLFNSENFGKQLKRSRYFEKDLELVLQGKNTPDEKTSAIFEFVKSKIKWNKEYSHYTNKGLVQAYKTGEGNIVEVNLVLVAMLRKAGIKANPILLSTKNNGLPIFPTLSKLNYVIVGVKNKKGDLVFLDASSPNNAIGVLPTRALNWQGRMLVNKKVNVPVDLVLKKKATDMVILNVKFDENLNISGVFKERITDKKALDFRNRYNKYGPKKLKSKLQKRLGASIRSFDITNENNVSKPLLLEAEVSNESAKNREIINNKLYINPLLFLKQTRNPFKLASRKYPVDLIAPYKQVKRISIAIPEGYKVVSAPQSFKGKMEGNEFSYKYLLNVSNGLISLVAVKEVNVPVITVEKYKEFKNIYTLMTEKNQEKIVLEKIH